MRFDNGISTCFAKYKREISFHFFVCGLCKTIKIDQWSGAKDLMERTVHRSSTKFLNSFRKISPSQIFVPKIIFVKAKTCWKWVERDFQVFNLVLFVHLHEWVVFLRVRVCVCECKLIALLLNNTTFNRFEVFALCWVLIFCYFDSIVFFCCPKHFPIV